MRQHPIPQNILDIEFKLFTKFTVREFVYMAVGFGFGGIFLYFFTRGDLPGIIAIPVFLLSSGIGLVLGLVPINDQKADVFLRNYIIAISNPTRRVWRNGDLTKEPEKQAITGGLDITRGIFDKAKSELSKSKIIGGDAGIPANQFVEPSVVEQIEREEKDRLSGIDSDSTKVTPQTTVNTPTQPAPSVVEQKAPTSPIVIPRITLSPNNMPRFSDTSKGEKNVISVIDRNGKPLPEAIVALKDRNGKIVLAQRTNGEGYTVIDKTITPNRYTIVVAQPNNLFPEFVLDIDGEINSIKVSAL